LPIESDYISAIIRLVRHHYHNGVSGHLMQAQSDRSSEAVRAWILDWSQLRDSLSQLQKYLPSAITAPIVDDYDFVRNLIQSQL
jgi:hypothetical protein